MSDKIEENEYGDSDIKVLEGLEAVRLRPGMYIGGRDSEALHHLLWEVVDNSADEALAGYGNLIEIVRTEDHELSVRDYGRGIPVGINETTGLSTVETVMTVLHAGGKFDSDSYKVSGGLHGVGISVVTALSTFIEASVYRDGKEYNLRIEDGGVNTVQPLKEIGLSKEQGTMISFKADPLIFKETTEYNDEQIMTRLRRSAFLNPKVRYTYEYPNPEEEGKTIKEEFYSENGIVDYIDYVFTKSETTPLLETFHVERDGSYDNIDKEKEDVKVKFAFTYAKEPATNVLSFVNNIPTPDGGPHLNSMFNAVKTAITNKAKDKKLDKKIKNFTSKDLEEGLTAIIAVYISEVEFAGQTKSKLSPNTAVAKATYSTIKDSLEIYLEENPKVLKQIIAKIELAKRAREAAERSREAIRSTNMDQMVGILPTKLADCESKVPEDCELFTVEGDSAAGGAKESRDSHFQAILSLKGKVLNILDPKNVKKMMKNDEIMSLITAIGAGVGKDFDVSKVRYHKIIIFTDADVDGGHIGFLLSVFFLKMMRPLVEAGMVYVVIPPLHKLSKQDKTHYFYNNEDRDAFLKTEEGSKGNWISTRFKGLGEMNPDQLEETGLEKKTRNLKQLKLVNHDLISNDISDNNEDELNEFLEENAELTKTELIETFSADDLLMILGGSDSSIRRWFLMNFTSEIDVDV